MANEIKVLKSNTLEELRQKTNEVSFDLGDNSQLDTTRLSDKVYTYTATTANGGKFIGNDSNSDSLVFSVLPDVSLDNTGGYIILKDSTSIPASFAVGDTLSQSGGYSCTLVAISTVDGKPKLLVKNSSGTFNSGQDFTDGTGTIAHANIVRQISESYNVAAIRVLKDSAELVQDLSQNGFHVIPLAGSIPLSGSPDVSEFHEGDFVYQGNSVNTATWSGTLYHASSTLLTVKTVNGSFNASTVIKNSSTSDTITGSNHGNITNYSADGFGIELNTPAANTNIVTIVATDLVDAVNEIQDDIGTLESLTQGSADLVTAINDHESDIGNMTLTGLSANNLSAAARELRTELGDVTEINDATGYSATTSVGGIKEIQGDIGDVTGLNTTHDTTLVGAINEIEGVFDASTHEISAGSNTFTINSDNFTVNSNGTIKLDAEDGIINLFDNTTQYGSLTNSGGNLVIKSGTTTMVTGSGANATFAGTVTAVGTSVFTNLDISGNVDIDGSLETDALSIDGTTVSSTAAELNKLDGATLSTSELNILDGATLTTSELNILAGVTASATDINLIDGITNGTVTASKAIITDSNKDITGGRNITISGELDAATLDISGNADIDGTLALGTLTNVETSITNLQSDVGSNNFTGGLLLNSLGSTSNLTVAIKTLESEIGEDANYASGTITYGDDTISKVLVNLNDELDALNVLTLTAGAGLSGGGTLAANRTFDVNVDDSSIEINSDILRVKQGGITNAMLAGSIAATKLAGSIPNSKLVNDHYTIATNGTGNNFDIQLGDTFNFDEGEAINIALTSDKVTISAELATEINAGVATFDGTDFTVTSGDVTINDERIEDIIGAMVSGNTEDGISVTYNDDPGSTTAGKLNFDIDDSSVVRIAGTQTISGNKTFTGDVDLSGADVTFGSGGSIQNFNTQFLTLTADTNSSGLRIDRSANTSATVSTSIDPDFFWDETQVGTGANNTSHRGWRLKGFSNASTPIANTADVVTFYNAKDLVSASNSSGITPTFTMNTSTTGEHQGIWDFDINVDNSSIEVSSDNLRVKAGGITNAMLAGSIAASKLSGSIPNSKISNPSITIGDSTIALGGTDTTLTGLTDIDLTSGHKTIFDGVGAHTLTLGDSTTSIVTGGDLTVTGDLTVSGDTTTLNVATLSVEDTNITVAKAATTSSAANGSGLTFGDYIGKATFTYVHSGTKLVSNKPLHATSFHGDGASLSALNASNISTGTIADARLPNSISSSITGNAATATQVYVTENNTENTNLRLLFHDGTGTGNSGVEHDDNLLYNPSSNTLTAGIFSGAVAWTNITGKPTLDNYQYWTLQADSGNIDNITSTEVVDFQGGNAISTIANTNGVEINLDSNSIAVDELNCSDGSAGQVLQTDGNGNLSFGSVSTANNFVTSASWNTGNGVLTLNRQGLSAVTVDLDNRYLLIADDSDTITQIRRDNTGTYRTGNINLVGGSNVTITETSTGTFSFASTDTNDNTTYTAGTGLSLSGTVFNANVDGTNTVAANSSSTTALRTYKVQVDSSDNLVVNVPWQNTQTPARLAGVGLSLNGNTIDSNVDGTNSVSPNSSTNTGGRTYKVQVDSSDNLVVNVPWSDTTIQNSDTIDMGDGFKVADANGTDKFTVTENEDLRFAASGAAAVSFDASTQKVTYSATNTVTSIRRDNTGTYRTGNINLVGGSNVSITETSAGTFSFASTDTVGTDTIDMGDGFKVSDNAGNNKFTVTENEEIRFVGTGATSVSFESSPQRITINSTDTNTWQQNTKDIPGYVPAPGAIAHKVWKTDASGNPAWRDDDVGLTAVALGTNHNTTTVVITNDAGANATINAATTSLAGVMTNADKTKLDGIATSANNYSLPLAANGTRGGAQIGYSENGKNYPVELSSEKMYVNVPWTDNNTTYSAGTGLDLSGTTFSLATDQRRSSYAGDMYLGHAHATAKSYIKLHSAVASGDTGYIDFYTSATTSSNPTHEFRMADNGDFHADGDVIAFSSTTASDAKLKDNIQKVEGALELVSQLDGVTFNWKKDGKASAGVIAQNMEKVIPSAVKEVETLGTDETHKVVDYNQLSALFIEAIKELKEENKLLKAEIEGLKSINS